MPNCPLADDCPSFSERIEGMGCQHYGDRGGAEWCNHYDMPIDELKEQPVKPGEEIVVDVTDIHESGAGVGRTEDGFIVLIDGLLPECRALVRIDRVKSSHAKAKKVIEKMPLEEEEGESGEGDGPDEEGVEPDDEDGRPNRTDRERLGSRDNFWGGDGA
ncbi:MULTISPECIES: TRAM domain-containing protein [Halolamina]|uniref:TRAM domain-containing protein n=1 Tax=Halolamina pelagica TaxID=699431 RepID=A0A1I5SAH8_9EURY|nr:MULTISPECIES: TRAM domain-containing protein [Halolamina]NHX37155.1 TRAM domain-containing protein [Halolamina sp. R1-12]SFP67567.1 TRAM domain-containing protein [Halolamina pelagica]